MPHSVHTQEVLHVAEVLVDEREAPVIQGILSSVAVLVKRQQAPLGAQARKDRLRMAAATERHVNIRAVAPQGQPLQGFAQQHGHMIILMYAIFHRSPLV